MSKCRSKQSAFECDCQGVSGHSGMHWMYNKRGFLCQWPSHKDIKKSSDMAFSITPPGHQRYISPEMKYRESWEKAEAKKTQSKKRKKKPKAPPK